MTGEEAVAVFRNPMNGYSEEVTTGSTWLWALLFGPFFYAAKGVWPHFVLAWLVWPWGPIAVLGAVAWAITQAFGIPTPAPKKGIPSPDGAGVVGLWFMAIVAGLYASRAAAIVEKSYARRGWLRVDRSAIAPELNSRGL